MLKEVLEEKIKDLKVALQIFDATYSNPAKVQEIADALDIKETDKTCPQTRRIIRKALERGLSIGAKHDGYFLIQTEKELQRYLNSLMKRQIALSERIRDTYYSFYG